MSAQHPSSGPSRRGTARSRARPDRVLRARPQLRRGADRPPGGELRRVGGGPLAAQRPAAGARPAVERGRRRRGVPARPARPGGMGPYVDRRPSGRAAPAARPGARPAGRDHRPHLLGVGQGPQARVRRAVAHRVDRALLRPYGARPPRQPARSRGDPGPDPGRGEPGAQGRRRDHLALELPLHDGAVRRAARPARRERGRRQARRPDHAVRPARGRAARAGRLPDRTCGRSSPAPARRSARP